MIVRISIIEALGSAPRDAGTAMWVLDDGSISGTIGGGVLEYKAIETAHQMLGGLAELPDRYVMDMPLGPATGQCCGGYVKLQLDLLDQMEPSAPEPGHPVYIYGAGNVGSALYRALEPLPFSVTRVDDRPDYSAELRDYLGAAREAPDGAWHLIMTHSHTADQALCEVLLETGNAGHIGLIGSQTKRARFFQQLRARGLDPSPIVCPIGVVGVKGKEPEIIAASVAAELLILRSTKVLNQDTSPG